MFFDGFGEGAEDDAFFAEALFEAGRDRDGIKDGINRHARQHFPLLQRDAELFVGAQQFGIDFIQRLGAVFLGFWRGVVGNCLVVDGLDVEMSPVGLFQGQPVAVGGEAEFT